MLSTGAPVRGLSARSTHNAWYGASPAQRSTRAGLGTTRPPHASSIIATSRPPGIDPTVTSRGGAARGAAPFAIAPRGAAVASHVAAAGTVPAMEAIHIEPSPK